jgi:hypothetical protein
METFKGVGWDWVGEQQQATNFDTARYLKAAAEDPETNIPWGNGL